MTSEQSEPTPAPAPAPAPVPASEPPPPYEPDLSLITELEKGLQRDSQGVELR